MAVPSIKQRNTYRIPIFSIQWRQWWWKHEWAYARLSLSLFISFYRFLMYRTNWHFDLEFKSKGLTHVRSAISLLIRTNFLRIWFHRWHKLQYTAITWWRRRWWWKSKSTNNFFGWKFDFNLVGEISRAGNIQLEMNFSVDGINKTLWIRIVQTDDNNGTDGCCRLFFVIPFSTIINDLLTCTK